MSYIISMRTMDGEIFSIDTPANNRKTVKEVLTEIYHESIIDKNPSHPNINPTDLYQLFIKNVEVALKPNHKFPSTDTGKSYFLLIRDEGYIARLQGQLEQKIREIKANNPVNSRFKPKHNIVPTVSLALYVLVNISLIAAMLYGPLAFIIPALFVAYHLVRGYQERVVLINQAKENHKTAVHRNGMSHPDGPEIKAALPIQTLSRRLFARTEFRRVKAEKTAAVRIQALSRGVAKRTPVVGMGNGSSRR